MQPLPQLQSRINYEFSDAALLTEAMTHPSLDGSRNNQRLEFLGDAVLGAVISHALYNWYKEPEGDLARRLSAVVRGEALVEIAKKLLLGECLLLSKSEAAAGGANNPKNLEDAMEALVGAIYIDGGWKSAHDFILQHWSPLIKSMDKPPKDAKTTLQEWAQGKGLPLPQYEIIKTEGAAHEPVFTMQVTVQGYEPAQAEAKAKKAAEQLAAQALLDIVAGEA